MCEYENSLIAWIDGELEPDVALDVQRHLRTCASCSAKVSHYREVSQAFATYCAAVPVRKSSFPWRWATVAAGFAAAAALILWMLPLPVEQLPLHSPKAAEPPAMAFATQPVSVPAPVKKVHHQTIAKRNEIPPAAWTGLEPSIEIAIPADAIFAPGAVPPGFTFTADLSMNGDGSPRFLRVQPTVYLK